MNTALIGLVVLLVLVGGSQSAQPTGEPESKALLAGQSHTNGGYVINEDGTDDDSRIEGLSDENLFYVDAGNDRVGIGTASPSSSFHVNGTTTLARSFDGFMAGGGIAPASVATGTVHTLYTHTGGPAICDGSQGLAYADATGFTPPFTFSLGTSTSAAASGNLIASSTFATSTDTMVSLAASLFRIDAGDEITMLLADGLQENPQASTTHFASWDIEAQVHCWLIGG